jgi:hypothetical protein
MTVLDVDESVEEANDLEYDDESDVLRYRDGKRGGGAPHGVNCENERVCKADCGTIVPGCTKSFLNILWRGDLIKDHYFQHSCMYRWGVPSGKSWLFMMIRNQYNWLVANHGYPPLTAWGTQNLQNFETFTYGVCSGQKKCAGFALSAMLSSYTDFQKQCQFQPFPSVEAVKQKVKAFRGEGYGGATGNIDYWDSNKAQTLRLLSLMKAQTDYQFSQKIFNKQYDFCSCSSVYAFHAFMKKEVIPFISQPGQHSVWQGQTATVFVANDARPSYYEQWRPFARQLDMSIANTKARCQQLCSGR